ncbi:MAG TPA: hypothetical protein VGN51_21820 [Acidimicrobiia bacterium]
MSVVSLDELELRLRRLAGVVAVGFVETDDLVLVEVQAGPDADDDLARDATLLAAEYVRGSVAVEVVRWGDGGPHEPEARLRLVDLATDPGVGEVTVRLARGDEEALGRASTAAGLPAAVEATIVAVRTFAPELPYLPGWARTVETTPDRRFLVVASVTDPLTRTHRRGVAEGATPIEGAVRATLSALNRSIARDL